MYLTDFQKTIVDSIIDNKVTNVYTFLRELIESEKDESKIYKAEKIFEEKHGNNALSSENYELFIVNDGKKTYLNLKEYVGIIEMLRKEGYILSLSAPKGNVIIIYSVHKTNSAFESYSIIEDGSAIEIANNYRSQLLIPMPGLIELKHRGFKTFDEFKHESEVKSRNYSMRWTQGLAIASILLSIITSVYNIRTYTTVREVKITSIPKQDTIKTVIVPHYNSLSDSIIH